MRRNIFDILRRPALPCGRGNIFAGICARLVLCVLLVSLWGCSAPWLKGAGGKKNENPCVVLALPASGPYASLANKIRRGAAEAQKSLLASGTNLRLENINTEEPEWLKKIAALPEMCAVVGGPMQDQKYLAARKAGLLKQRAFFAFLPNLQGNDEGREAWRFFPSPQDQIDALVRFATEKLNIRSFGAFYPDDKYGRRMAEFMEKALAKKKIALRKASYSPGSPASWATALKPLVNPRYVGKTPVPQTEFEAIFLPDSWKNMDMITTGLLYNGEDRLALLGTTLWESALAGKQIPKASKYEMAIFPSAWDKSKAPKQHQAAVNDLWSALGYDFVNFAVRTELSSRQDAAAVAKSAQKGAAAIRALAPINWNGNGVASERLYIYQIGPAGPIPADAEALKRAITAARERSALRASGLEEQATRAEEEREQSAPAGEDGESAESGEKAVEGGQEPLPDPTPVMKAPHPPVSELPASAPAVSKMPMQGTMSPTPVPSYKLRLPNKR